MLVEDEDAVRLFTSKALTHKGYEIIEAPTGDIALEILKEHKNKIDLLISDVMMPGIDGLSLARKIRIQYPKIKVILVSGYSEDIIEGGLEQEKDITFLSKPFSMAQLVSNVKDILYPSQEIN